jgi:hypothetical protein
MQLAHPEYDIFAEQVFRGIYTHLEYAFNMEKTRVCLRHMILPHTTQGC